MSPLHKATTVAERYDQAQLWAHDTRLPPDAPRPQLTATWPAENVRLLERYKDWLAAGGSSPYTVDYLYVPMAGHVLGLALKPHAQLDLTTDFEPAMDYIRAKRLSVEWTSMCRNALAKFQLFLRQLRGAAEVAPPPCNLDYYRHDLPEWVATQLDRYQHVLQSHWRPARLTDQTRRFWGGHTRVWRWLAQQRPIAQVQEVKRRDLLAYVDQRLAAGYAVSTINNELRCFRGFLLFLQENDQVIPQALLRVPSLKQPEALPKFLTDEQVRLLRDHLECRVHQARSAIAKRDALMDRAAFYLLWQSALRLGEVEELNREDLDLPGRRLMVRQGKGQKDRAVYLTDTTVAALREYFAVRGPGASDHVFLYRNQPVKKDLIRSRIKLAGARVGIKVHPHRLRHTCATQLLNAGCRVTSIQKFLGHQELNSTMIYARVHDRTAAEDYYRAMTTIEIELDLTPEPEASTLPIAPEVRTRLLDMATQLAEPHLELEARLGLISQLRQMLVGPSAGKLGTPLAP